MAFWLFCFSRLGGDWENTKTLPGWSPSVINKRPGGQGSRSATPVVIGSCLIVCVPSKKKKTMRRVYLANRFTEDLTKMTFKIWLKGRLRAMFSLIGGSEWRFWGCKTSANGRPPKMQKPQALSPWFLFFGISSPFHRRTMPLAFPKRCAWFLSFVFLSFRFSFFRFRSLGI